MWRLHPSHYQSVYPVCDCSCACMVGEIKWRSPWTVFRFTEPAGLFKSIATYIAKKNAWRPKAYILGLVQLYIIAPVSPLGDLSI